MKWMLRKRQISWVRWGALLVLLAASAAQATPLPWLDFGNSFLWDSSGKIYTDYINRVLVQGVTYLNGEQAPWDVADPIVGSSTTGPYVDLSISFDGNNTNDTIKIYDATGTWFAADIVLINQVFDPIAMTPNPFVAMLDNVSAVTGSGSRWIGEFTGAIDPNALYDGKIILGFTGSSNLGNGQYRVNGQGKIAPIPEPATMLLMGSGLLGIAGISRRFRK